MIGAGTLLLFLGARDFIEWHLGQSVIAEDYSRDDARPGPTAPRPQPGEAVAKLIIPRLDTQLYVVEGDDADELRRGPGHLSGTALPGGKGNCVIAGHRDTHFRVLKDIRKGDDIVLETRAGEFLYRVSGTQVVSPENTSSLQPTPDPELNLITCFPFYYVGSAPKRFVVRAQLAGTVQNVAVSP